jgi:prepilin-type N-terminal cleavage/methylation domain-containing protein
MKKAFTLLEMVFVLVVIGILAAVVLPRTKGNSLQDAGIQLLSHIRYTQHLALIDSKFDANDRNWFKKRWQLVFSSSAAANNQPAYTIFADTAGNSTGDANSSEIALNPQNSTQYMTGGYPGANALDINHDDFNGMKKLNLGMSYGVTSVTLSGGCSNSRIAFDNLGRPMKGDQSSMNGAYTNSRLITQDCLITLSNGNENLIISIRPETGYANIIQFD